MHIAYYLPSVSGGGAERVMITLANDTAARGHQVDLVLINNEGQYFNEISKDVKIVVLRKALGWHVPRVLKGFLSPLFFLMVLPPLLSYIKREKPDVILSSLIQANASIGLAKRLGLKTPVVIRESTSLEEKLKREGKLIGRLIKWSYPYADELVTVSLANARELSIFLKRHVRTIYNPVYTGKPEELEPQEDFVLGVGRLTEQKGFDTLIQACKIANKKLIILGEGPNEAKLKALGGNVEFKGFVANPFSWMKAAKVFVLSSRWEGLPNVLIQAMAMGTPVVSTDCPHGPSEILKRGEFGSLIPVDNVKTMALEINNAWYRERNSEVLCQRASQFSIKSGVDQYLELLQGVSTTVSKEY